MKQKKFGTGGPDVSVIGQGTWYLDRGDRKAAVAALRRGIEIGMTHIDTAEMYGDAELVIADAIAGLPRGKLFLVSKVLPSNASRRGTIAACERSLKRLKTDRLDCYLLHWRGSYPLEETVAAFERTGGGRKDPLMGRQQFRRRRSRRAARCRGRGQDRLQPGALSSAGARDRARGHSRGASDTASPSSPIRRSATTIFRRRAARAARCCRRSPTRTRQRRVRSRWRFSRARLRCSRFPKPRARSTRRRTPRPAISKLSDAEIAALDKAFPRGPKPRGLPML